MAKQSFVTGQVLTAAQLTSLQQTAMSGGAASAKTANYTLVAGDAGTAISMTSTSATTITVNTGLFAAGDTVFIQNLGTANCTITAGTATVNTAGSLILPQYDAGILYFVSASSAVFYDYIQVGATSPLTTKGDLYGFGTSDARIPIGTNGHILTADSTETLGLKWAAPAGGGGKVLQVVYADYSTGATVASTSFADTGLTASITPSATNSKILVLISQTFYITRNSTDLGHSLKLLRGATDIFTQGGTGGYGSGYFYNVGSTVINFAGAVGFEYLDSPNTTSSTTYKTQGRVHQSTNTGSVTYQDSGAKSTITLIEIGA